MFSGSCLCGAVRFTLREAPRAASHCHCRMCQRQHGAAFATYVSVRLSALELHAGAEGLLTTYRSSPAVERRFCGRCGSNISWHSSERYADWISVPLAALDEPPLPERIRELHPESRAPWGVCRNA